MTMTFAPILAPLLAERERDQTFSGAVLITQGDKDLFSGAYGYANRPWRIKNHLDVRFDTASVTKMFTTVAILQLIDQQRLSLTTRVIEFLGLTDTTISPDDTVYHLLTHSSGIGDDAEEEKGELYEDLWKTKPNYSVTTTADFLPQFIHKPPNFKPGEGCWYNNCAFILLGLLIEKITGLAYREYVQTFIFEKIGLTRTAFLRLDGVYEDVAEGYASIEDETGHITGWRKNIYAFPPIGSPDSGAYTTVRDLDTFLKAIQRGQLLSPELTRDLQTPHVFYRKTTNFIQKYGYGFQFDFDKQGKLVCYRKEGVNPGVSAVIAHYPDYQLNVSILANQDEAADTLFWDIHDRLLAGKLTV